MAKKFKEAAYGVLNAAEEPLTAETIVERAQEQGWIETEGKTPEATMAAQLYVDIKNNKQSPFEKVGKGLFKLKKKDTSAASPAEFIANQNRKVRQALKKQLHEMDPFLFEYLIAELLKKIGYENVEVTKYSGDGGIDVCATLTVGGLTNVKTVIQAKRHQNNIPGKVITQLRGSAEVDQRGLVITTSDFTKDARNEAIAPNKMTVSLVNGEKLIDLLIQHEVGVNKQEHFIYVVNLDFFKNNDGSSGKYVKDEKTLTVWPLPGGADQYLDTLIRVMEFVDLEHPTSNELANWFLNSFDAVNSLKTCKSYSYIPQYFRMIEFIGDQSHLTNEGKQFLRSKNKDYLFNIISESIVGFTEIMEFMRQDPEPKSENDILEYLKENLNLQWDTTAQVKFRLTWMENLGQIIRTTEGYQQKE
jgi:hypothetical protein